MKTLHVRVVAVEKNALDLRITLFLHLCLHFLGADGFRRRLQVQLHGVLGQDDFLPQARARDQREPPLQIVEPCRVRKIFLIQNLAHLLKIGIDDVEHGLFEGFVSVQTRLLVDEVEFFGAGANFCHVQHQVSESLDTCLQIGRVIQTELLGHLLDRNWRRRVAQKIILDLRDEVAKVCAIRLVILTGRILEDFRHLLQWLQRFL